jgi:hypothetical protein
LAEIGCAALLIRPVRFVEHQRGPEGGLEARLVSTGRALADTSSRLSRRVLKVIGLSEVLATATIGGQNIAIAMTCLVVLFLVMLL